MQRLSNILKAWLPLAVVVIGMTIAWFFTLRG